jgi:hypothetical protein
MFRNQQIPILQSTSISSQISNQLVQSRLAFDTALFGQIKDYIPSSLFAFFFAQFIGLTSWRCTRRRARAGLTT